MGVDFYPCSNCGETFCDCGPYAYCEDCGERLCEECMDTFDVHSHMCKNGTAEEQNKCPFCATEVVTDATLLAYLLNSLGIDRETAEEAFKQKVADKARQLFPIEVTAYKHGYKDAVTNYAVWKDGEQLVGVMQKPLKKVLEEVSKSDVPIQY